ncbi:MAG: NUDIX domain-containing protein [Candidatus Saccharibacteria bacterium]|nr:NUDIX domain-containing protein [Candidatus Saccharibacteria bacterium]
MENIQIVDENDVIIGYKPRNQVDYEKDIYRSSVIWIINSDGEALIAQRKMTKDKDPGLWGPSVAGTVEQDETYDSNAYKEAEEEVGLTGYTLEKLEKNLVITTRRHFVQLYKAVVDEPLEYFTPQPEEVEAVEWVKLVDLLKDIEVNSDKYVPSISLGLKVLEKSL